MKCLVTEHLSSGFFPAAVVSIPCFVVGAPLLIVLPLLVIPVVLSFVIVPIVLCFLISPLTVNISFVVHPVIFVVIPRVVMIPSVIITIVVAIGIYFIVSSCIGISLKNNCSAIRIIYINSFTALGVSLGGSHSGTSHSTHNQNKCDNR